MEEGQEGPIKCIFLCKFHPKLGPVIVCQYPENYISKEVFDAISNYLITKLQIKKKIITLSVFGLKISGFPNEIKSSKYLRNAFIFNLCFVCDFKSRTIQYEPVVKKVSEFLENLELENAFLSSEECNTKLPSVLKQILHDINDTGKCTISITLNNPPVNERRMSRSEKKPELDFNKIKAEKKICTTSVEVKPDQVKGKCENDFLDSNLIESEIIDNVAILSIKQVVGIPSEPILVHDHHVPILLDSRMEASRICEQWDLTTQQVLNYIDGISHIGKIAALADVHTNLVEACVQNLIHHKIVKVLPLFQFSNMYTTTPAFQKLYTSTETQNKCLKRVCRNAKELPTLASVMEVFCSLTYGVTVRELRSRFDCKRLNIDERRLINYGLLQGFIRRLHQYPVLTKGEVDEPHASSNSLYKMCNGHNNVDALCCKREMPYNEIMDKLEKNPDIVIILK